MPGPARPIACYALLDPKTKSRGQRSGIVRVDGRTREGRLLKQTRQALLDHIGAGATAVQQPMIERIAQLELRCALLDAKQLAGKFIEYNGKIYLAGDGRQPPAALQRPGLRSPSPEIRGTPEEMTAQRRDPVGMMLAIADRFMAQAAELDQRVAAAIEAGASHGDIIALMTLAATARLRALTAVQAAAPYVSPRLQAIEIAPASPLTRSRLEARRADMTQDEVTAHLRAIAAGTLTLAAIEADPGDDGADADDEANAEVGSIDG
jgi:hypothetical protein